VTSPQATLAGAEAVRIADSLGIRVGALLGTRALEDRVVTGPGGSDADSAVTTMRARLTAYLELAEYLDGQGIEDQRALR
jgi:hypothetical protein